MDTIELLMYLVVMLIIVLVVFGIGLWRIWRKAAPAVQKVGGLMDRYLGPDGKIRAPKMGEMVGIVGMEVLPGVLDEFVSAARRGLSGLFRGKAP